MIEVKGLSKKYENFQLKDINFTIEKNEFIGILGKSGSGKSTLLNILSGLDDEYDGVVKIAGKRAIEKIKEGKISMVFQEALLLPHLTVKENIAFPLKLKKIDKNIIEKKVIDILKELDLELKGDNYPNELSGGEKQRVSIGRGLITEPELLFMDEPFSALDYNLRCKMQELVKKIHKDFKINIIFITHDREEAFFLSDRIIILKNGEIVEIGAPEKLYNYPTKSYSASLLGVENILSKDEFKRIFSEEINETREIGIRGENIILQTGGIEAKIIGSEFRLGIYSYLLEVKGIKLILKTEKKLDEKVGDSIEIYYKKDSLILLK